MAGDDIRPGNAATGAAADDARIAFLCEPSMAAALPPPVPAGQLTPDWFRKLERSMGMPDAHGLPGLTVKACLPVTDAFSLGWIIPLATDVRFVVDETGLGIQLGWPPAAPFAPVEQHHPGQVGYPNPPFDRRLPLKWINPWRLKVPDGYSVLFTHPLNHFELPFQCFSGLVDCDRFAAAVNFPFVWTGGAADVTLPRGTPLIQVIPIRRDTFPFDHEARAARPAEKAEQEQATQRKYAEESVYARQWRARK